MANKIKKTKPGNLEKIPPEQGDTIAANAAEAGKKEADRWEKSDRLLRRIIKNSIFTQTGLVFFIFLFTKSVIYSIIFFSAATLSITGFLLMIKVIDRILKKRKGQVMFFAAGFLKMAVITATFYPVSRISETAVLFYILGLSVIVSAIMLEGVIQLIRGSSSGT